MRTGEYKLECPGGGRIEYDIEGKRIVIYGYSQGFGQAKHAITHRLVKEAMPADFEITWNNEGY